MASERQKTVVIGLGNLLVGDDGAGIHALRTLEPALKSLPVDLVEGGTPGPALLSHMQDREAIYFLDAGNLDAEPGTFARFTADEVESRKQLKGYSLHEFDLISFVRWAGDILGLKTEQIVIYCIQAARLNGSPDLNLSREVREGLPAMVNAVMDDIKMRTAHA